MDGKRNIPIDIQTEKAGAPPGRRILSSAFFLALWILTFPDHAFAAAEPSMPGWLTFLVNPWIRTLLLAICLVAIVIEFFTPTYGFATVIALASFALYFFSSYVQGHSGWVEIICFVVGALLMFIELTVEGFGPVGVGGLMLLTMGVIGSAEDPGQGVMQLLGTLAISFLVGGTLVKAGYSSRFMNRSVLSSRLSSEEGYLAKVNRTDLLGREGIALTTLRPAGEIEIGRDRFDAMTEGDFIPKNSPIIVSKIRNGQIIVRIKE